MYGFFIVAVPCLPCLRYRDGTAGGGRGATRAPGLPSGPTDNQREGGREHMSLILSTVY